MDKDQYFGELDKERSKNRRLQWSLGFAVIIILICVSTIRAQVGKDRVNFIPPEISKPFWISAQDAAPEYFEQMGQYVGLLPLNITPETAAAACNQYLTYILPKDRDKYRKKCDVEASRVRRDSTSQMFSVREVLTDPKQRRVVLTGSLMTFIDGKRVTTEQTAYRLEFAHSGGRFYVIDHERVDADDPFGMKKGPEQ
jgi:conjugal transfer pilus assembly protein TraE